MFLQGCGLCNSYFKLRVPDFNCRWCGSYFKPRVPDLIAGGVAPISNHVYPTWVPTLARHNISLPGSIGFANALRYLELPAATGSPSQVCRSCLSLWLISCHRAVRVM